MTAISIQEHVPLRDLTTLKVGGIARYFVSAATVEALAEAVSFAREQNLPFVLLGGGSNVLIGDGEIEAVVVKNEIRGIEWAPPLIPPLKGGEGKGSVLVIVGAGESWDDLVAEVVRRKLWGIENLSGIPGSVGAAPIQNIGAYGAELADVLEWVEVFDFAVGETRKMSNEECLFGYRDSIFKTPKGKSLIVTRVALRLLRNGQPNLEYKDLKSYFAASALPPSVEGGNERGGGVPSLSHIRHAVLEIRSRKFPDLRTCGTAGSFFKNPIISREKFDALKKQYPELPGFALRIKDEGLRIKVSLAWVLDNLCGLKGHAKGNVRLFERQPIVLVTTGTASAEEISLFAKEVAACVKEKIGIEIEWEVQYLW